MDGKYRSVRARSPTLVARWSRLSTPCRSSPAPREARAHGGTNWTGIGGRLQAALGMGLRPPGLQSRRDATGTTGSATSTITTAATAPSEWETSLQVLASLSRDNLPARQSSGLRYARDRRTRSATTMPPAYPRQHTLQGAVSQADLSRTGGCLCCPRPRRRLSRPLRFPVDHSRPAACPGMCVAGRQRT